MFDFKRITHVIENPTGHAPGYNFSLVGSVPTSMLEPRTPTTADVMGGRVQADGLAYGGRRWTTVSEILEAAKTAGDVTLCASPTCACRQHFPGAGY
jgi:hypothetical protein